MITAKEANDIALKKAYMGYVASLLKRIKACAELGMTSYEWRVYEGFNEKVLEQVKACLREKGFIIKDTTPPDYREYDLGFKLTISWE